ncbi:MAG TPA: aldehyde dehydrogenase family protein [Acidimicrobiales bacterium]|nr:aldehyde dehydrogenase family protein [Acidimicrobiales bacterium]
MDRKELYIGGDWIAPSSSDVVEVISPVTEEVIATVAAAAPADVDRAVATATDAFGGPWRSMSLEERGAVVERAREHLTAAGAETAHTMSTEMGMPLAMSKAQVAAAGMMMTAAMTNARSVVMSELRTDVVGSVLVQQEPVGPVGAIVPWNGPVPIAVLKVVPALLAGCPVVLKPSPIAPLSPFALAEAFEAAGLPRGMLSVIAGGGDVGSYLVAHPGLPMISFTGSTAVGREIGAVAGRMLKKVALELGGKSAAILLDDVDLAQAVPTIVGAVLSNAGQYCRALSRVLVPRSLEDATVAALTAAADAIVVGDPFDPSTVMGPLASEAQRARVEGYIETGRAEGARVAAGGARPAGFDRGWYVQPTVLAGVRNDMRVAQEEIFGPVVSVIAYDDLDEAIAAAGDVDYGLSGAVFTTDPKRGLEVALRVETGVIGVNLQGARFCAPCGGIKASGIGQEHGPEGFLEFLEPKTILLPNDLADRLEAEGMPRRRFT